MFAELIPEAASVPVAGRLTSVMVPARMEMVVSSASSAASVTFEVSFVFIFAVRLVVIISRLYAKSTLGGNTPKWGSRRFKGLAVFLRARYSIHQARHVIVLGSVG